MNIYQLQYFRTMAKMEHYTKASNILCITQPSLSNSIAALEDELGVTLFEKRGRNVVLTRYGKVFLAYVENALDEIKTGIDKVRELSGNFQLPVSIGFIYTLSYCFIPSLIAGFKSTDGNATVDFSLLEGCTLNECTPGLVKNLKSDKLDLIFISLLPKDPDIEFIEICDQDLVVITPPSCPLAKQDCVDLKDVVKYQFVHFSGKSGLKHEINRMFEKINVTPNIVCEVEDHISIAGLVASNVGIAIVPVSPVLSNFNVKVLPIANPQYSRKIYVGYMKNRELPLPVQKFIDYSRKHSSEIMGTKGRVTC